MSNKEFFSDEDWDIIMDNILRNKNDGGWGEYKLIKVLNNPRLDTYIVPVFCLMKTRGEDEYHKVEFEISTYSLEITDSGKVVWGEYGEDTLDDVYKSNLISTDEYWQLKKRFFKDNIIG